MGIGPGFQRAKVICMNTYTDTGNYGNPPAQQAGVWFQPGVPSAGDPATGMTQYDAKQAWLEAIVYANNAKDPWGPEAGTGDGRIGTANAIAFRNYSVRGYMCSEWLRLYRKCHVIGAKVSFSGILWSRGGNPTTLISLGASEKSGNQDAGADEKNMAINSCILDNGLNGYAGRRVKTTVLRLPQKAQIAGTNKITNAHAIVAYAADADGVSLGDAWATGRYHISMYQSTKGMYGVKSSLMDDQFACNDITNPYKQWFFYFRIQPTPVHTGINGNAYKTQGICKLVQWCVFSGRRPQQMAPDDIPPGHEGALPVLGGGPV